MFAFEPAEQQSIKYGAWGNPLHGLYKFYYGDPRAKQIAIIPDDRSHVVTFVGTPPMQVLRSVDNWMNTPEARLVDTGAMFTRDSTLVDFDEARANEWRDKGIVNNGRWWTKNNPAFARWVYTAPDGSRWSITTDFNYFEPNRVLGVITAQLFGKFKFSNEFWGIDDEPDETFPTFTYEIDGSAGVVDKTGVAPTTYRMDISNDGTKALYALGRAPAPLYRNFNQSSFADANNFRKSGANVMDAVINHHEIWAIYLLELSGTPNNPDDPFVVDLSIYKDQETAVGTVENDQNDEVSFRVASAYYAVTTLDSVFTRPGGSFLSPGIGLTEASVGPILLHITQILPPLGMTPEELVTACGWTREGATSFGACVGGQVINHVDDDPFNPTATKWIKHTGDPDPSLGGTVTDWEASVEYVVPPTFPFNTAQYNGFKFEVTVAHQTNAVFQPGVGASWQQNWEVLFDDAAMDIGDIPDWDNEIDYVAFDAIIDSHSDYYISKGKHTSDVAGDDPINEPEHGSSWENFWDGPFLVAVEDFWVPDRLFFEGWIIRNEYTEPAFSGNPILDINAATFRCIRSHESSAVSEPGNGASWRLFWEKANVEPTGFEDQWMPPVEYEVADIVNNVSGDGKRYTAVLPHTATTANQPPNAFWVETPEQPFDCPDFDDEIGDTSYHLGNIDQVGFDRGTPGHKASNVDIDYHVKDIYAWAHFRDDNTIKEYTVDVRYEQTKRDLDIDLCWAAPGRVTFPTDQPTPMEPDNVAVYSGRLSRGPSTVDEKLTYRFKTDGIERHEITIIANATASGEDLWTENYSTYPLTWDPSSNRTLQVFLEGTQYVDINDNFSKFDFGNTDFPVGSFRKQDWGGDGRRNDFAGGITFEFISTPYLQPILDRFDIAFGPSKAFPGPTLISLLGSTVFLDPIDSDFDDQFSSRPQRTQRQKDVGDPVPTVAFVVYSEKLVGPMVLGRKTHNGAFSDGQYDSVLEPNDFPWQQFGLFAPDAELPGKVTLTQRSPTVGAVLWLQNANYGDDISCAYDPFTHTIERNNQYPVVYI